MLKSRIIELVDSIPFKSTIYTEPADRGISTSDVVINRRAHAIHDPAFAWHFAQAFVQLRQPLPAMVQEQCIKTAFEHLLNRSNNDSINEALVFQHPKWTNKRGFLEALLLLQDLRLDEVAAHTGLTVSSVMTYEGLFWNVRDRLKEEFYMSELCFPETRIVEYRSDYWDTVGPRELMLRAAFNGDLETILQIFGTRTPREEKSAEVTAKKVKESIMAEAHFVVRAGGGSSKVAVLDAARKMIAATEKFAAPSQGLGDDIVGLTAIGLTAGESILKTAQGLLDDTEFDARLALQAAEPGNN
jgi:hypothetical protein